MVGVKNNRRARYTQRVIQETVLSLLQSKPINAISVTEVCARADVNRTTFYRYYTDVYDCVESIEQAFVRSLHPLTGATPSQALEHLLTAFYEDKKLSNLVFAEGKTKLLDRMQELMVQSKIQPPLIEDYQDAYIGAGLQNILKKWVKDGMPEPPHQLTQIIIDTILARNLDDLRDKIL
ncbi:TetR/AcrR family transcriptional regulator [Lactobacillus sp. HBUAS51381]|uniref:TetR/AcrR family transcriptional regulator n=1 Tax=Lactobacillus sp. HBUAS51381 TaxID=2722743 RepID=UPI0014569731|nr:TetR/AcrR family transcriptional regulator [Lactobacillus sp. HBUAS51381]NLR08929.1 TetR/AcrR family transcriptional regulator [Lactobacillus sp. HBUAS51381]